MKYVLALLFALALVCTGHAIEPNTKPPQAPPRQAKKVSCICGTTCTCAPSVCPSCPTKSQVVYSVPIVYSSPVVLPVYSAPMAFPVYTPPVYSVIPRSMPVIRQAPIYTGPACKQ